LEQRANSGLVLAPPPAVTNLPDTLFDFVSSRPYLVDKKPIDFARHRYLIEPYQAFACDRTQDSFDFVLMSAAQVGKSVTIMGGLIFAALKFWADKFGYFLPDREMADIFSSDRFQPMVASNPSLAILAGEADQRINGLKVKKEDRKRVRSLGASTIFFSYMGGKTSTEAIPMRGIFFDEVRRMKMTDIERASERVSHSDYPINCKVSTAGYPDCFAGETAIVVRHRITGRVLPVAIRDLADTWKEFDVLSYNRAGGNRPRWRTINGVICRGLRPMVTVRLSGGTTIRCTGSHRFAQSPSRQHVKKQIKWTPIADLPRIPKAHGGPPLSGVLTLTEFPNVSNTRWHDTTIDAPLDLLTCYAVGAWIAEGTRDLHAWHFWQNTGKPLRTKVKAWADAQGLPYTEDRAGVRVTLRHRPDLETVFAACGTGSSQKCIPDVILGGSPRQLSSLLDGLLDGDGHRRKAFTPSHPSGREWEFFTSSNILASQVMFLCRRLGKCPMLSCRAARSSTRTNARGRVITQRLSVFTVSYNPTSQLSQPIMNALAVTEVRSVRPDGEDLAYDIEVDGTPWFVLAESGALVHNSDIHHYFQRSDQRTWHARCRCHDGVVLTDHWPDCVGESKGEYFWRCPVCDKRLLDLQDGQYRKRTPEHSVIGFHIPQLISPVMTPRRIWDKWLHATDRQEFYNSTLGLPYVDPESILVPLDVALACVDHELHWLTDGTHCVMGVDQRGGENHVVIGYPGDGKLKLAHLEIVQGESPFDRLYELMVRYDVDCCVIDALPSYNEAVRFAKQFKRRVFLAYYTENVHMLRWSDRDEQLKALYRAKPESKFEHHVMLDRYKAIEFALMQWVLRQVACPTPEGLVQKVRAKGMERQSHICLGNPETGEQGLFFHLRSVARRKLPVMRRDTEAKKTVDTGEFTMVWEEIGVDPHFLHAFLYCLMANQRRQVTAELWVPQHGSTVPTVKELKEKKPDLSLTQAGDAAQIQAKILTLPKTNALAGTCGKCQHFDADKSTCQARRFSVQAGMPACALYMERAEE